MTVVVVAGLDGVILERPEVRFVGAAQDGAGTALRELACAARVELCSSLGVLTLAEVLGTSPDAAADAVLLAAPGPPGPRAFLYLGATLDPFLDRMDAAGIAFLPVPDDQTAGVVAAALAEEGFERFELVAGLGVAAAANVMMAVPEEYAVGLVP